MHTPLPVDAHRQEIVDIVGHARVTVIAGATGCGKTSRAPLFLLEAGFADRGLIVCSQPRRIAAMSVSAYAASCHGTPLGSTIGYQIRHENVTCDETRIKYATEGIILREMRADPLLRKYAVIIIDEVHERGVNQDVLLALLPGILAQRNDLKVVLMSATMDEDRLASAFNAPIVRIKGRTHPVRIEYAGSSKDVARHAADVTDRALKETDGDVLVFMPDIRHIRATIAQLELRTPGVALHALYGNQSPAEQRAVLDRKGRSVIVATNIAETSLTLEGLTAVVDSGLVKEMSYDPAWAASTFRVVPHAQNGCEQRAGRVGRDRPGVCYRLYDEADYLARPVSTVPELLRASLEPVLLSFKGIGKTDAEIPALPFMDAPRRQLWSDARDRLVLLRALTGDGRLTKDGERMSDIPLPPAVTRMVLAAADLGCLKAVATIAATFATRPIFVRPQGEEEDADAAHEAFRVEHSDFLTALKAITAWRGDSDREAFATERYLHQTALEEILDVEAQILAIMEEDGIPLTADRRGTDAIGRCIASGLIANLLVQEGAEHEYRSRCLSGIRIHPGSALHRRMTPGHMVASGIVESTRLYARGLHAVPPAWLPDIIPDADTLRAVPSFRFLKRTAKHAKRKKERRGGSHERRDKRGRRR